MYDFASWSYICEITEKSETKRGTPVEIPDFTRGAWKTMKPLGIETVDLKKMDFLDVNGACAQQSVG